MTRRRLDPTLWDRKDVLRRHLKSQWGGWSHGAQEFRASCDRRLSPFSSLENPKFPGILARLEESPVCQRLPLTSFLILPFQRITRLKMLVEVPREHQAVVRAGWGRSHCAFHGPFWAPTAGQAHWEKS